MLRGSIYDVAVDLRVGSPTYGRWTAVTLTAEAANNCSSRAGSRMVFARSNRTPKSPIRSMTIMRPNASRVLCWDDPTLAIDWPVSPADAVLSDKDRKLGRFADFVSPFRYEWFLMSKRFLITGGAGFIGSAVVRHLIRETDHRVLVVDKLTYAGNLESLAPVSNDPRYAFVRADIVDGAKMKDIFESYRPDVVMHLAAESHVDRSIDGPAAFIQTNIIGTYTLLEAALAYWRALPSGRRADFRFHHVSTDEVFGSLGPSGHFTRNDTL